MTTPSELVSEQFANANNLANESISQMETFTDALSAAAYAAPTIDIEFAPVAEPSAIDVPDAPSVFEELEAELDWDGDGSIAAALPAAPVLVAPSLEIDDFTEEAPEVEYGDAPVLDFGEMPSAPSISAPSMPSAPTITLATAPELLEFETPTFAGLDLNTSMASQLATMPALVLAAPTAYTYTPGAAYSSALLTAATATLTTRLAGGTGIASDVENAIWTRARDREAAIGAANEADVTRTSEALGFHLPAGVTAAQLRAAQQLTLEKTSSLSRDVAIKQAELEQQNARDTVAQILQLEGMLVDYSFKLESIAFESAKAVAQNAVDRYNAQVGKFRTTIEAFTSFANAYDSIIKAQLASIEELKAYIAIEQAKADINRALVGQYEADIRARLALVEVYRAQLGGAQTLMQIENLKLQNFEAQIRAYVGGINGEVAKVEAYKATVQGEAAKVSVYESKARAFSAKANAQADEARAQVSYYVARIEAFRAQMGGWEARVRGETARFQALSAKAEAIISGYKAQLLGVDAQVSQDIKRWEVGIKEYEATAQYTLMGEKINTEIIQANRAVLMDAAKTGAQVYSQLTAAALSRIHTSAGVSAAANNSVSYSYSNQTATSPTSVTAV